MVVWASRVVTNNEGKLYLLESSDDVSQKMKDVTRRVVTPKKIIIRKIFRNLDKFLVRRSLYHMYMMLAQNRVINRKELEYTLTNALSRLSVSIDA